MRQPFRLVVPVLASLFIIVGCGEDSTPAESQATMPGAAETSAPGMSAGVVTDDPDGMDEPVFTVDGESYTVVDVLRCQAGDGLELIVVGPEDLRLHLSYPEDASLEAVLEGDVILQRFGHRVFDSPEGMYSLAAESREGTVTMYASERVAQVEVVFEVPVPQSFSDCSTA